MPQPPTSHLQQTYVIAELVERWYQEYGAQPASVRREPIVLFDRHAAVTAPTEPELLTATVTLPLTLDTEVPAEVAVVTPNDTVPEVAPESIEEFSLPRVTVPAWTPPAIPAPPALPQLPTFPTLRWPAVTLPSWQWLDWQRPSLPHFPQSWVSNGLHFGSQVAYAATIATIVFFFGPVIILESQSVARKLHAQLANQQIGANQAAYSTATPTPLPTPAVTSAEDVFSLSIPSLDIASTVVPNVDTHSQASYEAALQQGIAHAAGTGLPDQLEHNKTIYLFAHSTDSTWNIARYNAQFYALKDIKKGALITLRFWGEDYTYRVVQKDIIAANDVMALTPQTEKEQLILQTCYPPGTAWKRLLVTAEPVTDADVTPEGNTL